MRSLCFEFAVIVDRIPEVKELIIKSAVEQAELMLGDAVTYTVIDWAKENADSLLENQPTIAAKTVVNHFDIFRNHEKESCITNGI